VSDAISSWAEASRACALAVADSAAAWLLDNASSLAATAACSCWISCCAAVSALWAAADAAAASAAGFADDLRLEDL